MAARRLAASRRDGLCPPFHDHQVHDEFLIEVAEPALREVGGRLLPDRVRWAPACKLRGCAGCDARSRCGRPAPALP